MKLHPRVFLTTNSSCFCTRFWSSQWNHWNAIKNLSLRINWRSTAVPVESMLSSVLRAVNGMESASESHDTLAHTIAKLGQFNRPKIFQSSQFAGESSEASSSTNSIAFSSDDTDHSQRDAVSFDTVDAMNFSGTVMQSKKRSSGSLELPEAYLESDNFVDELSPRFDVNSSSSYNSYSLISSRDRGNFGTQPSEICLILCLPFRLRRTLQ